MTVYKYDIHYPTLHRQDMTFVCALSVRAHAYQRGRKW